ncbi:unnamed protein product [Cylicocyclus nassatus]|uniref:Uncharacterized protein n=1 Tax=Cylicocyclus nassatus TaxID=53992 RepID=A0AA36GWG0_CYLNA|nr:unnamed protein product [Cylicocyclus nassatus]
MACLFVAAKAISVCFACSLPFIRNTTRCKICNAIKAGKNVYENVKKLKAMFPNANIDKLVKNIRKGKKGKNNNSSKRKPVAKGKKKKNVKGRKYRRL